MWVSCHMVATGQYFQLRFRDAAFTRNNWNLNFKDNTEANEIWNQTFSVKVRLIWKKNNKNNTNYLSFSSWANGHLGSGRFPDKKRNRFSADRDINVSLLVNINQPRIIFLIILWLPRDFKAISVFHTRK